MSGVKGEEARGVPILLALRQSNEGDMFHWGRFGAKGYGLFRGLRLVR